MKPKKGTQNFDFQKNILGCFGGHLDATKHGKFESAFVFGINLKTKKFNMKKSNYEQFIFFLTFYFQMLMVGKVLKMFLISKYSLKGN